MKQTTLFLVTVSLWLISACSRQEGEGISNGPEMKSVKELEAKEEKLDSFLKSGDPVQMALAECRKGDLRLLEILNASSTIPAWNESFKKVETRVLEGTSDSVSGERGSEVQGRAVRFATAFNAAKLGWMASRRK